MDRNPEESADKYYENFVGTDKVYNYIGNIIITDGVKEVAEREECFWFLDVICSYQKYKEFQNTFCQKWKLERIEDTKFQVTGYDYETESILVIQDIEFSDFFFSEFTIYKMNTVLLLPSEN